MGIALDNANRDGEAMLANRVRQQIHIALRRLEKLSFAYRLTYAHAMADPKISQRYEISFTSDAYATQLGMEYRACINELYSLRDAILAAAYRLRFGRQDGFKMAKLKSAVQESLQGTAAKIVFDSMFSDTGDRLIDLMSLYRSISLHCLGATNPVVGDVYQLRLSQGVYGKIPYLVYPLYDDVGRMREIERGASKAIFENPDKTEAQRFMSLPTHRDALEFCFDCFVRLLRMAEAFGAEIGIAPEVATLTDDEILNIVITEDGATRRYRKNPDTDRLEEY